MAELLTGAAALIMLSALVGLQRPGPPQEPTTVARREGVDRRTLLETLALGTQKQKQTGALVNRLDPRRHK